MSHLAPFAYVQQLVCVVALLLLFVRRVSQSEHGWRRVLAWRRLRALQLRSVVALTLVCALLCLLAYSVVLTVVKYDRVDEDRKHSLRRTGAYLWTAHAVLRTSSLFLVVAEWYAMTSDIQTPRSLSRFEFHLVYVWTLVSACLHIALRAIYHAEDDRALVPQLLYSTELIVVAAAFLGSAARMRRTAHALPTSSVARHVISDIAQQNVSLAGAVFADATALLAINIDSLRSDENQIIVSNDLAIDLLANVFSLGLVVNVYLLQKLGFPTDAERQMRRDTHAHVQASRRSQIHAGLHTPALQATSPVQHPGLHIELAHSSDSRTQSSELCAHLHVPRSVPQSRRGSALFASFASYVRRSSLFRRQANIPEDGLLTGSEVRQQQLQRQLEQRLRQQRQQQGKQQQQQQQGKQQEGRQEGRQQQHTMSSQGSARSIHIDMHDDSSSDIIEENEVADDSDLGAPSVPYTVPHVIALPRCLSESDDDDDGDLPSKAAPERTHSPRDTQRPRKTPTAHDDFARLVGPRVRMGSRSASVGRSVSTRRPSRGRTRSLRRRSTQSAQLR